MDAKELRIGSYYKAGLEIVGSREAKLNLSKERAFKLTLDHLKVLSGFEDLILFIKPIPLTEEWLLKFGLKVKPEFKTLSHEVYLDNGFQYMIDYYYDEYGHHVAINKNIKYVHQLQDLYRCLTGEELEIKG